jgi:hypothetical protein
MTNWAARRALPYLAKIQSDAMARNAAARVTIKHCAGFMRDRLIRFGTHPLKAFISRLMQGAFSALGNMVESTNVF